MSWRSFGSPPAYFARHQVAGRSRRCIRSDRADSGTLTRRRRYPSSGNHSRDAMAHATPVHSCADAPGECIRCLLPRECRDGIERFQDICGAASCSPRAPHPHQTASAASDRDRVSSAAPECRVAPPAHLRQHNPPAAHHGRAVPLLPQRAPRQPRSMSRHSAPTTHQPTPRLQGAIRLQKQFGRSDHLQRPAVRRRASETFRRRGGRRPQRRGLEHEHRLRSQQPLPCYVTVVHLSGNVTIRDKRMRQTIQLTASRSRRKHQRAGVGADSDLHSGKLPSQAGAAARMHSRQRACPDRDGTVTCNSIHP